MAQLEDPGSNPIERAAVLVSRALDLLDASGGPVEATTHLDLALGRLRQEIVRRAATER